jgi:hypothetical protein
MTRFVIRLTVGAVVAIAIVLGGASLPVAQEVTGPALKAAFLFNFVKFTTWPADVLPDAAPLVMCVVNDPAVGLALSQAVGSRVVLGHQLQVVQFDKVEPLDKCQVVYVSGARSVALQVVALLRDAPVFTVSDVHAFNAAGGIAQLHVQQGQLRFAIAVDAARKARLQISARLLALARQP